MEIAEVRRQVWQLGGVARRDQLDVHHRVLARAVDCGAVLRVARGTYALSSQTAPLLAAAQAGGVASHASAAQLWLLDLVSAPELPHVTVRRNRRLTPAAASGLVPHWSHLPDGDVDGLVTTPLRTVVDCARTMPFPEALAVADSAMRRHLVEESELLDRAERTRGAGRQSVLRVARYASAEPANPFESALRGIAITAGVTGLRPQLPLEVRGSFVRPDLVDPRLRLVAEADSFEWHGRRQALASDCRRYDELVADGWTVLRFAWEQVMFDREWVAEVLTAASELCQTAVGGRGGVRKSA
ncbi:DUF559 domain-containing protein [Streptomyces sp. NP160]|uniref:DUF559 domain-containing protein n=1 Tax=Streptomyces sp. NP160 TaxID=2586637 RepID=UPI00111B61CE|nr:DUF559 domain-containing protein [Streptomyces sp. NP160]TNM69051.1 DUF559 domain-containing protein [Streptomyces sp. NP160]